MKLLTLLLLSIATATAAPLDDLTTSTATFHGHTEHRFALADGTACKLVPPKTPAPGNPWVLRARFWGAFPKADIALLDRGYHLAYCDVGRLFGNATALGRWDRFYKIATTQLGLHKKVAVEGLSRGGLPTFLWASKNPEKIACLYADAPVCTVFSWPVENNAPDSGTVRDLLKAYNQPTVDALRLNPPPMPVDESVLKPLAEHNIPVLIVAGLADTVVPYKKNAAIVAATYKSLGGEIKTITKPGIGHHPHALDNPTPIVDFITTHTQPTP